LAISLTFFWSFHLRFLPVWFPEIYPNIWPHNQKSSETISVIKCYSSFIIDHSHRNFGAVKETFYDDFIVFFVATSIAIGLATVFTFEIPKLEPLYLFLQNKANQL
jgi:hypothetical protein